MKILAILLSFVASTAFAQSDIDIALALAKAKAKAHKTAVVPCDAQASQMAKHCPCGCEECASHQPGEPCACKCENCTCVKKLAIPAAKPKAAPKYRTVNYPPVYEWKRVVVGKQCHGTYCTPVYGTVKKLVRPPRTERVPVDTLAESLPPDQQPTPMTAVGEGLKALNLKPTDTFVEFGCGHDARWAITAVRLYGLKQAYGVEIDPAAAESARRYVAQAGFSDRIIIITGDATTQRVYGNVGVAYLWPESLAKLVPQIKKLDRFVSYSHAVPGLPMTQRGDLWLYQRPAPRPPVYPTSLPAARPNAAVWNGRLYTHPVCNNPRCSMCAAIRAQLAGY